MFLQSSQRQGFLFACFVFYNSSRPLSSCGSIQKSGFLCSFPMSRNWPLPLLSSGSVTARSVPVFSDSPALLTSVMSLPHVLVLVGFTRFISYVYLSKESTLLPLIFFPPCVFPFFALSAFVFLPYFSPPVCSVTPDPHCPFP